MLLLLQECLEYIEQQFKYMKNFDMVTIATEQKYERLHYKITNHILNTLHHQHISQNVKTVFNKPIDAELDDGERIVINVPWLNHGDNKERNDDDARKDDAGTTEENSLENCNVDYHEDGQANTQLIQNSEYSSETTDSEHGSLSIVKNPINYHYSSITTTVEVEISKSKATNHIKKNDRMFISRPFSERNLFKCDDCGVTCSSKYNLNRHHQVVHEGKIIKREKTFKCEICDMKFSYKSLLSRHMLVHNGEKTFKCEHCEKKFSRKDNMLQHIRMVHTGERSLECEICGKMFAMRENMRQHILRHIGEKSFGCKVCGNKFVNKSELAQHKLVHTGEKPFKCQICKKVFSQRMVLKRHMLIHTGDKPYKCEICDRKFSRKDNVKQHMLIHSKKNKLFPV